MATVHSLRKKVTHVHDSIFTSYHEAGHTIYALLHHMKVYSVRIFPEKRSRRIEGFTHINCLIEFDDIEDKAFLTERLDVEVCFYYAGLVAEKNRFKLASGSDKFPSILYDAHKDVKDASKLIKDYQLAPPGDKRYNYKKRMIRRVARELQQYWGDVVLIAHALYNQRRLYFSDLETILTKKSENKKFWKEQLKKVCELNEKAPQAEKELISALSS